jgi:hypothetical protein
LFISIINLFWNCWLNINLLLLLLFRLLSLITVIALEWTLLCPSIFLICLFDWRDLRKLVFGRLAYTALNIFIKVITLIHLIIIFFGFVIIFHKFFNILYWTHTRFLFFIIFIFFLYIMFILHHQLFLVLLKVLKQDFSSQITSKCLLDHSSCLV